MRTNILQWSHHYEDILNHYYSSFCLFLTSYKEPIITYNEFVIFCYRNTKRNYLHLPGVFHRQLHAPLV